MLSSFLVRSLGARSEPETRKPASASSCARADMLMPPMPTKYREQGWLKSILYIWLYFLMIFCSLLL